MPEGVLNRILVSIAIEEITRIREGTAHIARHRLLPHDHAIRAYVVVVVALAVVSRLKGNAHAAGSPLRRASQEDFRQRIERMERVGTFFQGLGHLGCHVNRPSRGGKQINEMQREIIRHRRDAVTDGRCFQAQGTGTIIRHERSGSHANPTIRIGRANPVQDLDILPILRQMDELREAEEIDLPLRGATHLLA